MALKPVVISRKTEAAAMSGDEWQMRVDLAACYRLIALYDMDDLFATHISARVPGPEEHFLLNPYGVLYTQITASNLVKVDLDGNIVGETEYSINPAGFVIHSAVHLARPDATISRLSYSTASEEPRRAMRGSSALTPPRSVRGPLDAVGALSAACGRRNPRCSSGARGRCRGAVPRRRRAPPRSPGPRRPGRAAHLRRCRRADARRGYAGGVAMTRDFLFALMGSPHESDAVGTALRLAEAMLGRGADVSVWACGNATLLTQESLELTKPRNVFDRETDFPTSAAFVAGLLARHPDRFDWAVCHFCSHDRGATAHIAGVRTRPAMFYPRFVAAARRTITVGRL
jgi:sulfur relay (sulfurtransferase) complex TusBCD TusD component (DsrE family)